MADELDVARERVRQQLTRDVAGRSNRPRLTASREDRLGTTFRPGDRVIDAVTGEEATVEGSYRETVILPDTEG